MLIEILSFQMEEFLQNHEAKLPLPPAKGDDTIFEFAVNEQGEWEHWGNTDLKPWNRFNYHKVSVWRGYSTAF